MGGKEDTCNLCDQDQLDTEDDKDIAHQQAQEEGSLRGNQNCDAWTSETAFFMQL